ncbi:type II secretion system protein [Enterococcus casseliflavus]|uniref:type II secretion system protein n=1 Tax=Enterococcus casseliflavus TaxID=37734 RepID=UPI0012E19A72|nr:prepilin-type N-terminal cleavage/methylation domain-containing protein [Enterococcus casseliflavus]MUN74888.1 prepilin-type N-terminal cleavage/methylation domain-containing protein [Enterococcus casseliflavus]MUN95229.1 prepilin-type N-terminal cleavage/methylation domain-containing protein [Enterococcus casseliflavus]
MIDAILAEETTDNRLNKLLKDERGLSLVELLAVVVILAIIAGIGVIAIGNVIQNSREDAAVADVQQAFSAAILYQSTNRTLNDGTAGAANFNLTDVIDDGLLSANAWTVVDDEAPDDVQFYVSATGELTMYVPGGVLRAGQITNRPVGAVNNGVTQSDINSLTRETLFSVPDGGDGDGDD